MLHAKVLWTVDGRRAMAKYVIIYSHKNKKNMQDTEVAF